MNPKTSSSKTISNSKVSIYQMAAAALMTALMCALGPLSIPIGPVPISLTNFVIYIAIYLLGTKSGTISYCLYLLIGMVGLPVFSAYSGALSKLAGPTGGYLIGFIPMAVICGIFIRNNRRKTLLPILGMVIGTITAYFFGTVWFIYQTKCNVWYALTTCVFPFLIGDAVKILLSSKIGPAIYNALNKAHLLENL